MVPFLRRLAFCVVRTLQRPLTSWRAGAPGHTADLAICIVILIFGIMYFTCYMRAPDLTLDATYPELARSLVENGRYEFDFSPETIFPPAFPMMLALVCRWAGFSPAVLFHVVAVFATLGLLATYELLRRVESRALAAGACVLLGSTPALFLYVTQLVFAEMPYLFFSTMVLLLAFKMDRSRPGKAYIGWMLVFAMCLVFAITIRSIGIALLMGIVSWIVVSFWAKPNLVRRRIALFCGPLILGLGAQLVWTEWAGHRQAPEWSAGTWQQSYVSQLRVKDGDRPELGMAAWHDIPARIGKNLYNRAAMFSEMLTRHGGTGFWSSPAIIGVIVLIVVGLAASLWRDGGQLHDWYFFSHEMVFLLWPWDTEGRFVLPVFALGCLYLWRGGRILKLFTVRRPRVAAFTFIVVGAFLAFNSAEVAASLGAKRWQAILASVLWSLLAFIGCAMAALQFRKELPAIRRLLSWPSSIMHTKMALPMRAVAVLVLAAVVGNGCAMDLDLARHNLNPDLSKEPWYSDIEAALWIRSHEPADLVIMARKQDLVFHYSRHRVVFFPAFSDPKILMDGVRTYHVRLIVVAVRKTALLEPSDVVCFTALLKAYPSSFHLIYSRHDSWIYEVNARGGASTN